MTIRKKIIFAVVLFLAVIVANNFSNFYFNNKLYLTYQKKEKNVEIREFFKSILNIFSDQVRAYEFYLYLNDNPEKFTFLEKRKEVLDKLKSKEDLGLEVRMVANEIEKLNSLFDDCFEMINSSGRNKAIEHYEKQIISAVKNVQNLINSELAAANIKLKETAAEAADYREHTAKLSFYIFSAGIVLFIAVSINMYRSIMKPLKKLEEAAHIFGSGDLEHKVRLKSKNEFMSIANAFNKMVDDLKQFHVKTAQMGKMAAIGELAGGVAHEINNPLTGILGHIQIMLKHFDETSKYHSFLKKMERAAIRCKNIVADLLDFSGQKITELQRIRVRQLLEETFSFCEKEIISQGVNLKRYYSEQALEIDVHRRQLQHAFLNIINNAIQAMPEGGVLTVSTSQTELEEKKYIQVNFKDTGKGFSDEVKDRLFEPFFTTKEVGEGTGLGLSLTYRIIKDHSGFIEAESGGPGQGAVFKVYLPA